MWWSLGIKTWTLSSLGINLGPLPFLPSLLLGSTGEVAGWITAIGAAVVAVIAGVATAYMRVSKAKAQEEAKRLIAQAKLEEQRAKQAKEQSDEDKKETEFLFNQYRSAIQEARERSNQAISDLEEQVREVKAEAKRTQKESLTRIDKIHADHVECERKHAEALGRIASIDRDNQSLREEIRDLRVEVQTLRQGGSS